MPNAEVRRCQVKKRKGGKIKRCQHRNAQPVFTTTLKEVTKRNPQPRWICPCHMRLVTPVDPYTGFPRREIQVKSYVLRGGELVPLNGRQRYAPPILLRGDDTC